ncbi:E3 ubiquitin-protein ligase RING1-like [Chenopodium quinoa]|uniref:RING-type E3 ubiquitin transferase n=1 Tax=Chenopodium quinoa TaxID=63459 RepID=A0A803M7H2_CHEQI|nr:E3 ubiquitin-protein ligase RING1-like [Chenopodium quinoa]
MHSAMKILSVNTLYDFTVVQTDTATPCAGEDDVFQIEFRYRNFQSRSQSSRSIRIPRNQTSSMVMIDTLQEFEVPETTRSDMAAHFDFFVDRLSRRGCNRRGSICVKVNLDAKEFSPETAEAIQRRIESGRRENERGVRRVAAAAAVAELEAVPPLEAVVEGLERKRVAEVEDEGECSICLEKLGVGTVLIVLPCLHVYHTECIIRWLERTHFCPFCRFKLPC